MPVAPAEQAALARACRGNAVVGALVALLAMGGVGWTPDVPRELDERRMVMGPSVLEVQQPTS